MLLCHLDEITNFDFPHHAVAISASVRREGRNEYKNDTRVSV